MPASSWSGSNRHSGPGPVIAQDLADVLIATIADRAVVEAVVAKGLKAGDPFDPDVGGLADESAGQPVRIKGTITRRRSA
jgi:hypothetical protein